MVTIEKSEVLREEEDLRC